MDWQLAPSVATDADWIAELRAVVMRPDLERLGRFDPQRVRDRFRSGFNPAWTNMILVDDTPAGCVAVRPAPDGQWIEHFYLDTALQGQGIGTSVLQRLLQLHAHRAPFRLNVLQGSAARRLYERHGFVVESEDPVDVFMVRHGPGVGRA